jgi:hypothetical protein
LTSRILSKQKFKKTSKNSYVTLEKKGGIYTDKNKVVKALKKRALGYETTEITEEYVDDGEGGIKMLKRKVIQKNVPPDVSAVKLYVELTGESSIKNLSDEELQEEKIRLLKMLKE